MPHFLKIALWAAVFYAVYLLVLFLLLILFSFISLMDAGYDLITSIRSCRSMGLAANISEGQS